MQTIMLATVLASIAHTNHGVVTREQLLASGIPQSAIDRGLRSGRLQRMHPGIYLAVGAPDLWLAHVLALALYIDRQLRRKHQSAPVLVAATGTTAAHLLGFPWIDRPTTIALATNPRSRSRTALTLLRDGLTSADVTVVDGVLVTNHTWTLIELAAVLSKRVMENITVELLRTAVVTVEEILATAMRMEDSPGRATMLDLLAGLDRNDVRARSGTERRLFVGVVERGHPAPAVSVVLRFEGRHQFEFDLIDQDLLLNIEIDGPHHQLPEQRRRDRERDAIVRRAGVHVHRIPVAHIDADMPGVLDRLDRVYAMRERHMAGDHGGCDEQCTEVAPPED